MIMVQLDTSNSRAIFLQMRLVTGAISLPTDVNSPSPPGALAKVQSSRFCLDLFFAFLFCRSPTVLVPLYCYECSIYFFLAVHLKWCFVSMVLRANP